MFRQKLRIGTLLFCLLLSVFAVGCGNKGSESSDSSALSAQSAAGAGLFTGVWKRTNIEQSQEATITIAEETKTTFLFTVDSRSEANIGSSEGVAHFVTATEATCQYIDNGGATVTFSLNAKGDVMTVTVTNNAAIGLGNNVTMDGEYTKGEPVYHNVSRVSPLSEQEVMREARILLGNDAYQFVADIITDGTWLETIETAGVAGQMYRYTVQSAGLGADILSGSNGHLYIGLTGYSPEGAYVYYTDDSNYRDKMPSDFDMLYNSDFSEVEIYFRGK